MHPGMGLRTIYEQFSPEGIGRDSFIALGLRNGFRLRAVQNPQITTRIIKNRRYPNLLEGKRFTGVNQLWTSDIFYFSLQGRHYYGVLIMDVYSRRIVGWSMAKDMRAENNVRALMVALTLRGNCHYGNKLIHHSDRGSQYVSNEYTDLLTSNGFSEIMSLSLTPSSYTENSTLFPKVENVGMLNPLSSELDVLRQTLLYGGLEAIAYNQNRKRADLKLYEFGKSYHLTKNETSGEKFYTEQNHLSLFITGKSTLESWQNKTENSSIYTAKYYASLLYKD